MCVFVLLGAEVLAMILVIVAPQLNFAQVVAYQPKVVQLHSVAIGTTLMFSMWVDGTTASADYCRWAQNAKASWVSVFIAFPWASCFSFLLGAVVAIVSLPHGGDVLEVNNGFRAAINLTKVDMSILKRGSILANPGLIVVTDKLLARITMSAYTKWS